MRLTEADLAEFLARGQKAATAIDAELTLKGKHRRAHPEDDIQRAVCEWWAMVYPDTWRKTFHPPNGLAAKNRALAAIFKALGVKAGVFDLICIARRGCYNGLAIELKAARGHVTDGQNEWLDHFHGEGWYACVAWNIDEAHAAIDRYHQLPEAHV